ncbi:GDP-mannose 4,6-dehydratase [Ensifer adhaerens]|uniref:GDP-mannose 4,6-dehydratase n=1 Tax=Ensifer adhaerens TaxID=106592 RepID=UPI0009EB85FA|nr:GDP-mannose 4,6-dehydratase [Ensifer adhaerens]
MTNSSNPTILMTGGAGFVGRVLCGELLESFASSRRVLLSRNAEFISSGWETAAADITDFDAVGKLVADVKPDIILHLAAQASVANAQNQAEQTWRTNVVGTMSIGSAVARWAPAATVLSVSSGEVYGASLSATPATEAVQPNPQNPYSWSKLVGERVLRDILTPENRLIIARPFNHSGAGQDRRFVLPSFAAQIVEAELGLREPQLHVGNLEAKRDFLHVNDVVAAYVGLLQLSPGLPRLTVVNICSGNALPVSYYLSEMRKLANLEVDIIVDHEKMRPSDIACSCGDNSLLRSLINWSPTISATALVQELLTSWRNKYG